MPPNSVSAMRQPKLSVSPACPIAREQSAMSFSSPTAVEATINVANSRAILSRELMIETFAELRVPRVSGSTVPSLRTHASHHEITSVAGWPFPTTNQLSSGSWHASAIAERL